jgi:tRNA_anti-like
MGSGKRWFIFAGILLSLIAISAWYVFLKPGRNIQGEKTISVTATSVFQAYQDDEKKANLLYLDKALAVSGKISEVKTNQQGQQVIVLATDDPIFGVVCTMAKPIDAAAGKEIRIKGFCTGYATDVVLRDCINENQ